MVTGNSLLDLQEEAFGFAPSGEPIDWESLLQSLLTPQEQFEQDTFVDAEGNRWIRNELTGEYQLISRADRGGGGSVGRVQFPSEVGLDLAQTDQIRAMIDLLMPQFELEQDRFGLEERRFGLDQLDAERRQEIERLLLDVQQGRLSLDQLQAQIDVVLSRERLELEGMLGGRGLDIQESQLTLQRELGFASLEEQRKDRALDSALGAISSYLAGMSAADARRLSASQETRALIPFMVDPNQQFFSGMGPESALARASGPGFQPQEISSFEIPDPSQLAQAPTQEQIGGGLLDLLGGLPQ